MKNNLRIYHAVLIFSLITSRAYCQDEDEEEEEPEVSEEESTSQVSTKSEEKTTLDPLTRLANRLRGANGTVDPAAVSALVKAALKNANRGSTTEPTTTTTLDPIANITKILQDGNKNKTPEVMEMATLSPALLAALVQAALQNRNRQAAIAEQQQIQAAVTPAPVPQPATPPQLLGPDDPDGLQYIMGQVNKIMESVVSGNISGIIENSLRIRAPSSVQAVLTNILTFLNRVTGGIFGLGPPTPRPTSTQLRSCPAAGSVGGAASPPLPKPPVPPSRAAAAGTIG